MERHASQALWIETDGGYLPQSLPIDRSLDAPEVQVSLTLMSDMGRPVLIERVCIGVSGNSTYTGDVTLTAAAELPQRQVLGPCEVMDLGRVTARCAVRHKPAGASGESTMPFGLCAWVEWRSNGEAFESPPVTLQAYEPVGFARADDAFSLTPVD